MNISKWIVYDLGTRSLTSDDRIEELVKTVIEVCEASPEFLDSVDAKRHAFFLRALTSFNPPDWTILRLGLNTSEPVLQAGDLPIKTLPGLLEDFVLSYFDHSQLLPHFALDTSDFLLEIASGLRRWEPHQWRIEPLIAKYPVSRNFDRGFRATFTRRGGGSVLVGTVPLGFNVIGSYYVPSVGRREDTVEVGSGTQFAFKVTRCHLSHPWNDFPCCLRIEPEIKTTALGDEFLFVGSIRPLYDSSQMNEGWDWDQRGYFEVPHGWITHEVCLNQENKWTLIPIPNWEEPAEAPSSPPSPDHSSHSSRVMPPAERPTKKKAGVYLVPATPVCSACGIELSPAMLVWQPEQRFCGRCKRAKKTNRQG
jgi:hypothetical protein